MFQIYIEHLNGDTNLLDFGETSDETKIKVNVFKKNHQNLKLIVSKFLLGNLSKNPLLLLKIRRKLNLDQPNMKNAFIRKISKLYMNNQLQELLSDREQSGFNKVITKEMEQQLLEQVSHLCSYDFFNFKNIPEYKFKVFVIIRVAFG